MSYAALLELDRRYVWHPFTQMREWTAGTPVMIVEGEGAILRDANGKEYIDGNSSIWTNIHGHRRRELDEAIRAQLDRIAHSSFLGLTNDLAPRLAFELLRWFAGGPDFAPPPCHVFFSDDGSTAIEAGLKMIHQARIQRGEEKRTRIISLGSGYHGDTVGAMSLGHSPVFHKSYGELLFDTREVMSPHCYRCPFNRAEPVRGTEGRLSRKCQWECLGEFEKGLDELGDTASAFVLEPRVQGAGSLSMHPEGYLHATATMCRDRGVWLFLDEVFTGFGRTGSMFAFQKELVEPDVVAIAKGFTGGYLPMAATVVNDEIYDAFLGTYAEFKTFFHGHSYCGNQLGSAVALANLEIFAKEQTVQTMQQKGEQLGRLIQQFWAHPNVGDVRREGMICAIELVEDFVTRKTFPVEKRTGFRVCEAAREFGLLTRNIGDVLLLMPPACTTDAQLAQATDALWKALNRVIPIQ